MDLRIATLEDFAKLRALNAKLSQPDNLPDPLLKSHTLWVATERTEILGYIHALRIGDEVEIVQISVDPKFQRQGIGKLLLEKVKFPNAQLHLEVASRNVAAIAFYQSLGFQVVGTRKKYYADGNDAFRMRLN